MLSIGLHTDHQSMLLILSGASCVETRPASMWILKGPHGLNYGQSTSLYRLDLILSYLQKADYKILLMVWLA